MTDFFLAVLLFAVGFLYASVGHGGASGYIAVLSLAGFTKEIIRPSALILNCFIASVSFLMYLRKGFFRFRLFWPFAVTSVPMTYIGSILKTDALLYNKLLALFLLLAAARIVLMNPKEKDELRPMPLWIALSAGAILGILSGILGIGGGIILSPVMLLMGWATTKEIAPVSALFIVVNSISGLLGIQNFEALDISVLALWLGCAFTGGLLGAWLGSSRFSAPVIRFFLALVLVIAGLKLFFET